MADIPNPPKSHLKVRDTPAWTPQDEEQYSRPTQQIPIKAGYGYNTLWLIASGLVILFNTVIAVITIRDMFYTNYNPYNHYFMTCAFTFTLGALALIQKYIIDRGN